MIQLTRHDLLSPTTGTSSSLSSDTRDMVISWFPALGGSCTVIALPELGIIGTPIIPTICFAKIGYDHNSEKIQNIARPGPKNKRTKTG